MPTSPLKTTVVVKKLLKLPEGQKEITRKSNMKLEILLSNLIKGALNPSLFELENESHRHNVPKNSETHFKAIIVSDKFDGLSRVKRHQLVYKACKDPLEQGLHALAMQCFTKKEWALNPERRPSPECKGGMKKVSR